MDPILYQKTLPDKITELLKDGMAGSPFKFFYYGDPFIVPATHLPCVCVELQKTMSTTGPTGNDKVTKTIEIKLLMNKMTEFGKSPAEVHGARTLEQWAEGLNATTGNYDVHSVAGILRKNFTIGNTVVGNDLEISYGVTPRGNNELLAIASITATIEIIKPIPGRV